MKIGEIITGLRNLSRTGSQYRRAVCRMAADTIEAQQKRIREMETTDAATNADRIRAMTNEELAQLLYCSDSLGWCRNLPDCGELLDTGECIPEANASRRQSVSAVCFHGSSSPQRINDYLGG